MARISPIILTIFCGMCAIAVAQTAPTQRIRGDVVSLEGSDLKVKSRTGEMVTIKLADNYSVTAVVAASLDQIKPGAFVGAASMPQADGTQRAIEVLVFPESGRGSNEGHYPWDLQPGSMMTNATIADVQVVAVDQSRRLTVRYKDGEKIIIVPQSAPIVTFEPGDRAMVKPGAHVIVTAARQSDGTLSASRILAGRDGLVPPM